MSDPVSRCVAVLTWFWSDMDSTSQLGDIPVQRRVSSHLQLVCMMASHAVASWSHYHSSANHFTKSSSEEFHEAFTEKQHVLGRVRPASNVLENRSYFLIFAHKCSGFGSFVLKTKCASQKQMAGVLAINVEKCSDVSQEAIGGRETHMKSCTSG